MDGVVDEETASAKGGGSGGVQSAGCWSLINGKDREMSCRMLRWILGFGMILQQYTSKHYRRPTATISALHYS